MSFEGVTSSKGVNSHLPIHNRFYGFTSWSRTRTKPIDCPWIFMINQLWGVTSALLYEGDTRNRWRDGQVCPRNYGALGQTARVCFGVLCANRTREVKRDFGDLRIRRGEGRVVNTPLVFKRVLFQDKKKTPGERKDKKEGVGRERKDKRVRKILLAMRCFGGIPSCEKCWIQVSPVPASDEVCPPAGNRITDLANVCILSENRTTEVSEPVNKCRPLINPVVNKSVENATSRDFEKENCDPPVRGKEFNVNRSSDCDVKMKVGVCEGRVRTVAMGAQRVINPVNIGRELKRDKGVANPEGLICENSCEEKYTLGTLMGGCEKQLTVDQESF
ncbi:uncharacterized protein TNCV_2980601 [Trichonephila clavipes]|nr:uncharacterized protein TNCV_2980601 [Trichonephila clavipes]